MELEEFGPDDGDSVRVASDLDNAVSAVDAPWEHRVTPYRLEMRMRYGWDGEVGRHFLAYDAGSAVGHATLDTSEWDNRDLAWLGVRVHPDHRRQGHGTAILGAVLDHARGMGRTLAGIDGWDDPAVAGFAASTGFEARSRAINRRMHYADVDLEEVRTLRDAAAAPAAAYDLVRIEGHTPDDLLDAVAELTGAINDAPTDDLEIEDEVYPPERILAYEHAMEAGGHRFHRLLARHRETGALGGHTVVGVDVEKPGEAHQHDTSVVAAHRGHRLGLLLKAEMVLWLAEDEPQVTTVDTWNAESNSQMISVNEQLGYRVMGREVQYQRRL